MPLRVHLGQPLEGAPYLVARRDAVVAAIEVINPGDHLIVWWALPGCLALRVAPGSFCAGTRRRW